MKKMTWENIPILKSNSNPVKPYELDPKIAKHPPTPKKKKSF